MKRPIVLDTFHLEDVAFLADDGLTMERIAARVGARPTTIQKACLRDGRKDLLAKIARNRVAGEMGR